MFKTNMQKDKLLIICFLLLGLLSGVWYASVSRSISSKWSLRPGIKDIFRAVNETEEFLVPDDTTVADDLARKVSVLCWMLLESPNYKAISAVNTTWGKRCTKTLFLTNFKSNATNMIDIRKYFQKNTTTDTRMIEAAYQFIYRNYREDFDWYLKTTDETYIVVENLRYLLYAYDPSQPLSFGHRINEKHTKISYFSDKPGYVLSKNALERLIEGLNDETKCKMTRKSAGLGYIYNDLYIGNCLQKMDVIAVDSRENKSVEKFIDRNLDEWLLPSYAVQLPLHAYDDYKVENRLNVTSNYSIAFGNIDWQNMPAMELFVYQLHCYGMEDEMPPLPAKIHVSRQGINHSIPSVANL